MTRTITPPCGKRHAHIPTQFPASHPDGSDVTIVGDDGVGLVAESASMPGFRYYLTDCCLASAKGSMGAVVCRCCHQEIDDALGGVPPRFE